MSIITPKKMQMLALAVAAATPLIEQSNVHAADRKQSIKDFASQTAFASPSSVTRAGKVGEKWTMPTEAVPADSLYSNTDFINYQGSLSYEDVATVGTNTSTEMIADDIMPAVSGTATSFTFSLSNGDANDITIRPQYRVYDSNGSAGGPGTLLYSYTAPATTLDAGYVYLLEYYTGGSALTLQAGHTYWTGVYADNANNTTGATASQLENLGADVFDPPDVGSSADQFFDSGTLTTGTGSPDGNTPAGRVITAPFSDGTPANFARQFRHTVSAAPTSWKVNANGTWQSANNWTAGVPNDESQTAVFGPVITAPRTVTVGNGFQVGTLSFTSPIAYTLAEDPNADASYVEVLAEHAAINVTAGNHVVNVPLYIDAPATVTIASGSSLTATNLGFPISPIVKEGGGLFAVETIGTTATTINAGTIQILQDGTDAESCAIGTLTIAGGSTPTATLDLVDNDLDVFQLDAGTKQKIEGYVRYARDGGQWDRPGLTASAAKPTGAALQPKGLGILSGAEYLSISASNTVFAGFTFDPGETLVKFTYNGDADLNGVVNAADYHQIDTGYQNQHTAGFAFDWFNGDFDYNGVINSQDYALIDAAYQLQSGTLKAAISYLETGVVPSGDISASLAEVIAHNEEFGTAYANAFVFANVPEPTTLCIVGLASAGMLARRRRRA